MGDGQTTDDIGETNRKRRRRSDPLRAHPSGSDAKSRRHGGKQAIRASKKHGRLSNPSTIGRKWDWTEIERRYVVEKWPRKRICDHYDMPVDTFNSRAWQDGYKEKRDRWARAVAILSNKELMSAASITRSATACTIAKIAKIAAEKYLQQLMDPKFKISSQDLDRLERLKHDLLEPGWAKAQEAPQSNRLGAGQTNVLVSLGEHIDKRRVAIKSNEERTTIDIDPDSDIEDNGLTDTEREALIASGELAPPPEKMGADALAEIDARQRRAQRAYARKASQDSEDGADDDSGDTPDGGAA